MLNSHQKTGLFVVLLISFLGFLIIRKCLRKSDPPNKQEDKVEAESSNIEPQ